MTENIRLALEATSFFTSDAQFEQTLNNLQLGLDVKQDFIYFFMKDVKEGTYYLYSSKADVFIKYCESLIANQSYKATKKDLEAIEKIFASDITILTNFIIHALQSYEEKKLPFFEMLSIYELEEVYKMSSDIEMDKKELFFTAVRFSKDIKKLVHLFDIDITSPDQHYDGWQPRAARGLSQEYQNYLLSSNDFLIDKETKTRLAENMANNIPLTIARKENIYKVLMNGESIGLGVKLSCKPEEGNHAIGVYSFGPYLVVSNSGFSEESKSYIKFYRMNPDEKVTFFAKNMLTEEMISVHEFETSLSELPNKPIILEGTEQEGGTCGWRAMQNNLLALWILSTTQQSRTDDLLTAEQLMAASKKVTASFNRLYNSFCLSVLHQIIVVDKECRLHLLQDPLVKQVVLECFEKCHRMEKIGNGSIKFKELKAIIGNSFQQYAYLLATDVIKRSLLTGTLFFSMGEAAALALGKKGFSDANDTNIPDLMTITGAGLATGALWGLDRWMRRP